MNYDKQLKKYGTDKIFLLALFTLSLLLAYLIVRTKKNIVLGKPVEIPEAGLSVRLPNGNGWQCDDKWKHYEDILLLRSVFIPSPGLDTANIVCTYRLSSGRGSAHKWLEQYAAHLDAANPEYGTQQTETVDLEWVYIQQAQHMANILAATTPLGHGRWLDIEITQMDTEDDLVQKVLEKTAKHIVIKENKLLERGIETVSRLKSMGLERAILQQGEPFYYLVKNSSQREIGFLVEMLIESVHTDKVEIQAAGFGYVTKPNRWELASLFKGNSSLEEYTWESETDRNRIIQIKTGPLTFRGQEENIRTSTRISVSDGNQISVHMLGAELKEFEARISEAAIPSAVIEAVYNHMVNENIDKIMVDIILNDGQVKPAVIRVKKAPDGESQVRHIANIEYLGSNEMEEIHLDNKKQVVKKILRQDGILVLEPASLEDLVRRFPERADYIIQRSQTIKQDKL